MLSNPLDRVAEAVHGEGVSLGTVTRTLVNATASGNTEVVAAQGGGKKIRILSAIIVATTALTVKFQSATTDIAPGFPLGDKGGMVLPHNPQGWFQTAANEALNVNLSAAIAVGVQVVWCVVE